MAVATGTKGVPKRAKFHKTEPPLIYIVAPIRNVKNDSMYEFWVVNGVGSATRLLNN